MSTQNEENRGTSDATCVQCDTTGQPLFCVDCCNREAWAGALATFERCAKMCEERGAVRLAQEIREERLKYSHTVEDRPNSAQPSNGPPWTEVAGCGLCTSIREADGRAHVGTIDPACPTHRTRSATAYTQGAGELRTTSATALGYRCVCGASSTDDGYVAEVCGRDRNPVVAGDPGGPWDGPFRPHAWIAIPRPSDASEGVKCAAHDCAECARRMYEIEEEASRANEAPEARTDYAPGEREALLLVAKKARWVMSRHFQPHHDSHVALKEALDALDAGQKRGDGT